MMLPPERIGPEALAAIGLPAGTRIEPTGGATGETWKVWHADTPFALRCTAPDIGVRAQIAAMNAAREAGLPVPEVVCHARTPSVEVVLSTWLRGKTMAHVLRAGLASPYHMGQLMGRTQRRLHGIPAPAGVSDAIDARAAAPAAPGGTSAAEAAADVLLHMDLHPSNVLVDGDIVSGIVDWVNARHGHPLLELARTYLLLTVDPALPSLPASP